MTLTFSNSNERGIQVVTLIGMGGRMKDIQFHLYPSFDQLYVYKLYGPISEIDIRAKLQSIIEPLSRGYRYTSHFELGVIRKFNYPMMTT
jgi:uncharacterized protein YktB (UPF0637 family)